MPAHKVIRVVLLGWWLINKLLYFFRIISQTGSIGPAKKDKVSTFIKIWKLSFHIPFQNNVNPELKINLGLLRNVITGQENFSSVTTSLTSKQKHEVKKRYLFSRNVIVVWFFFFWSVIYVSGQNDGQTDTLSGPMVILTGHCPLTGCYFEPSNPHGDWWICPLLLKLIHTCPIQLTLS